MNKPILQYIKCFVIFAIFIFSGCKDNGSDYYEILILNGNIVDGSGEAYYQGDIGINGDLIVKIGDLKNSKGKKIIDATDLIISPGFIDVHSHSARGLIHPDRSDAKALLTQGLTTVFVNPDGGGSTNLDTQRVDLLKDGLGINVAQMVPHGSVREEIMGMEDRFASEEEIEKMKALVDREMKKGAFGLSSGPFYTPGSYSETKELIELSKVIKPYNGVYTSHIRDESNYTIGLEAAVDEVITIAREAEVTGIVTHIKALGPPVWGLSNKIIKNINAARKEGVSVFADQYPYDASATGLGAALLPRWSQAGGRDDLLRRLDHQDTLIMIKAEMTKNLERRGGPDRIQFRYYEPDNTVPGKTLEQVAEMWNLTALDAAIKLIKGAKGVGIISHNMQAEDIHNFMSQEWTMTCSDGSYPKWGDGVPHPRAFGSFPRKIRKYVLEEKVVTLPFAIRSMTGLSADIFGMKNRGYIKEGYHADIVIIDLDKITDKATFTEPFQYSEGVKYNILNGVVAIDKGQLNSIKGGRILIK